MVKKGVLTLLIALAAASKIFAGDLSVGLGGTLRVNFSDRAFYSDTHDNPMKFIGMKIEGTDEDTANLNRIGGGFFGYFDTSYIALSVGMSFLDISPANKGMKKFWKDNKASATLTTLDIGLLGKIPIPLGGARLFPAAGVDFRIPLDAVVTFGGETQKWSDTSNDNITKWLTEVWFKLGVGTDLPLSKKVYLRSMFLYGIGTLNKADKEAQDEANKDTKVYNQVNHGFDFSLALGLNF